MGCNTRPTGVQKKERKKESQLQCTREKNNAYNYGSDRAADEEGKEREAVFATIESVTGHEDERVGFEKDV